MSLRTVKKTATKANPSPAKPERARWMVDWLMNAVLNSLMQRRKKASNYHLSASNLQEIHTRMHQNASRAKKLRNAEQWQRCLCTIM